MNAAVYDIEGMHCGHCVATVDKALRAVPGVTVVSVEVGRVEVELDRPDLASDVEAALASVGYPARA
jgi:copper chaperone